MKMRRVLEEGEEEKKEEEEGKKPTNLANANISITLCFTILQNAR